MRQNISLLIFLGSMFINAAKAHNLSPIGQDRHYLIGQWKMLSSHRIAIDDGEMVYPYGPNATGTLKFDVDGMMKMCVQRDHQFDASKHYPFEDGQDLASASLNPEINVTAIYTFDENTLSFTITECTYTPWLQSQRNRTIIRENDNRMVILHPPMTLADKTYLTVSQWERH